MKLIIRKWGRRKILFEWKFKVKEEKLKYWERVLDRKRGYEWYVEEV